MEDQLLNIQLDHNVQEKAPEVIFHYLIVYKINQLLMIVQLLIPLTLIHQMKLIFNYHKSITNHKRIDSRQKLPKI